MRKVEDNHFLKQFGQNLKTVRISKGFTQEHLADCLNVEISQISRIERGVICTSIINLKKIADSLKVDVGELFNF